MKDKYALLDTDFISKMHQIKKDDRDSFIDRILELPGYRFFCHERIVNELSAGKGNADVWLQQRINAKHVICYSDADIIDTLQGYYGNICCAVYTQLLRESCEAFRSGYFSEVYGELDGLDYSALSNTEYLSRVNHIEETVGIQNNIGEIKSFVLQQLLSIDSGEKVYVFCSDDKGARRGAISFQNTVCISVLSSFLRLKKEIALEKTEAEPYIESWLRYCSGNHRTTFRVEEAQINSYQIPRVCRIPCNQVMEEIYEDKFLELKNGDLRYKA